MKKYLIFYLFIVSSFCCRAQNNFNVDCGSAEHVYGYFKGDTIDVLCDTVYAMNTKVYGVYKLCYDFVRSNNIENLAGKFKEIDTMYQSRIAEQKAAFEGIKMLYDSLSGSSREFLSRTNANINDIDTSLSIIQRKVSLASQDIDKSIENIKASINKQWWTNTKFFGAGVIVSAVLLLIR